jgi:hypothetical protein
MYAASIRSLEKNGNPGNSIYLQPFNSEAEVNRLKDQLINGDEKVKRKSFYFPLTKQAFKVESVASRFIEVVKSFFTDLFSLPSRWNTYGEYKNEMKKALPIYQFLQNLKLPQKYLDQDRFEVLFFSGEEPAAPYLQKNNLARLMLGEAYDPKKFEGRNYQMYSIYRIDLHNGVSQTGGGLSLIEGEFEQKLKTPFVAKA